MVCLKTSRELSENFVGSRSLSSRTFAVISYISISREGGNRGSSRSSCSLTSSIVLLLLFLYNDDIKECALSEGRVHDLLIKGVLKLTLTSINQDNKALKNKELKTWNRVNKELIIKLKKKYIKKQWLKTRDD